MKKKVKQKDAVITVMVDNGCEMAEVRDNYKNGMSGNFWDFYDGCHGITKFGSFNSMEEFIAKIELYHVKKGRKVKIVRKEYKYED